MTTPFLEIPIVADLLKFHQVCVDKPNHWTRVNVENVISALNDIYKHSDHPVEAVHARIINLMVVHLRDL